MSLLLFLELAASNGLIWVLPSDTERNDEYNDAYFHKHFLVSLLHVVLVC